MVRVDVFSQVVFLPKARRGAQRALHGAIIGEEEGLGEGVAARDGPQGALDMRARRPGCVLVLGVLLQPRLQTP